MWSRFGFVARGVGNSLRQLFWTHLLTCISMTMALFIFGGFMLLQENLQNLLKGWSDQIQINAYLDKSLTPEAVEKLSQRVRSLPEVERVRYISQERAWKEFQAALGAQASILEGLPPDVLPASFEISVKRTYREGPLIEDLAARLRKETGITSLDYPQEWIQRLSVAVLALEWAKWILGGILFMVAFFIVGSTVKLAILARKDEIEMMQLFGASETMIKAPFVVEGMTQGIAGGLLSIFCLWSLFQSFRGEIPVVFGLADPFTQFHFLKVGSMALIVAIGWLLGAAGSLFSLKRFLKSW